MGEALLGLSSRSSNISLVIRLADTFVGSMGYARELDGDYLC
jgi:hypothetical protein